MRGYSGIYLLYRRKTLYYVGLASNFLWRLKTHAMRDRHAGKWDRLIIYRIKHVRYLKERTAEQGDKADEAFRGTRPVARAPDERCRLMPALARNRGDRLAAYRQCSTDAGFARGEPRGAACTRWTRPPGRRW